MRRFSATAQWLPLALLLICLFSLPNLRVSAAVIRVDEACSLHDAITAANTDKASGGCPAGAGADTIYLSGDITLSAELPAIESVIAIDGGGFAISGDKRYRIFRVGEWPYGNCNPNAASRLTINQLLLKRARGYHGSALYIASCAEVTIYLSQLADNYANEGGAIFNWGDLKIEKSRLSGNLAVVAGNWNPDL